MKILIIDGQGGRLGGQLAAGIRQRYDSAELIAVGTNTAATENMLKCGAERAATGENAVIVACRSADVIIGPLGIAIADALYGEVTPRMALAVAQSRAVRILIPFSRCDTIIAGLASNTLSSLIDDALSKLDECMGKRNDI